MSSTFFGINVARSALAAQTKAVEVLGYNIAHANDPAYKRQRVVFNESTALSNASVAAGSGVSSIGSGVTIGDVQRVFDALIENRLREATQTSSDWEFRYGTMQQMEAIINEPSNSSLQTDLDNFWSAWQKVATTPESLPMRSNLLQDAAALCQRIQDTYTQMTELATDLNVSLADRVNTVNVIGAELARLNIEIGSLEQGQIPVNDLLNRRDALLLELSQYTNISTHGQSGSGMIVSIGGHVLVQGSLFNALQCSVGPGGSQVVEWASDGQPVRITGGEMNAITELRDSMIPSYLSQLDSIAVNLVEQVNALHRSGKTLSGADGGDFLRAGTTAANISLDPDISVHPELVAASRSGAVGDGDIALAIAHLKNAATADGLTINQLYRKLVGDIGGNSAIAKRQAIAYRLSLDQFTTQQQSVSGVSLDEEMTNMIKFQQVYNAAARTLTVMDEMLSVMIERMGLVGR